MTCKECIHNAVCYLRNYCITSDYANKCGYYFSDNVIDNIKAEIQQVVEEEADDERWSRGLHYALKIIDKHIGVS